MHKAVWRGRDRLRPGDKIIAVSRDLEEQGLVCGTEVESPVWRAPGLSVT